MFETLEHTLAATKIASSFHRTTDQTAEKPTSLRRGVERFADIPREKNKEKNQKNKRKEAIKSS